MADQPFPKLKIPHKPQPQQPQKKKKNAPDRPQPTWLFPADEENPVLNPKAKSPEEITKEKNDRSKALDYMKRRVHAAPDRPAPPPQLLTLIGIFLSDFGFNSTSRLFTNERKARQELNGWEDAIGKKIEKNTPKLEKIYRDWYREWKLTQKDETSSSGSGSESDSDSDSESREDEAVAAASDSNTSNDDDSEASSDGLGGSDVDMKNISKNKNKNKNKKEKEKETQKQKEKKRIAASSSSSSDSDADDEDEPAVKQSIVIPKKSSAAAAAPSKPTVKAMINNLKRKASESSSDPSSSGSDTSSEDDRPAPPKKVKTKAAVLETKSAANSKPANLFDVASSSESSSSSESEDVDKPKGKIVATKISGGGVAVPTIPSAPSDSSATIDGSSKKVSAESDSSSSSSSTSSITSSSESESEKTPVAKKIPDTVTKKQHQGAKPTPLAELSSQADNDAYLSNRYVSYAYADKAYQDLSVTRGKGFTKEKNKKKRGSYRGGAIDTSGGKGFKFED